MHLLVSGPRIPAQLLELVAAMTDHATLRPADVTHDASSGTVRLPITRFPLIEMRRVRGNRHDRESPIPAVVTVRSVVSCEIEDAMPSDLQTVQMLFGIQLGDDRFYLSSVEESRGKTCFSITLRVSALDVEIADADGDAPRG